jgi:hypothetical protein
MPSRAQELEIEIAGDPAAARRRLRRTRRRSAACGSSRPFARRSAVQIASSRGVNRQHTGQLSYDRPFLQKKP